MYTNAQYQMINGIPDCIKVDKNEITCFVPLDPDNTDYQNLMALKDSGQWPAAPIDGYSFDSASMTYYILPIYKMSNPTAPDSIQLP